jgi:hypothetical protein
MTHGAGGEPLSVGRQTRVVPRRIRRALKTRDGGCRFPGCTEQRFVDAHHIRHWVDGGETSLANLILLCGRHHHLLHERGFSMEALGLGQFRFCRPGGEPIENSTITVEPGAGPVRMLNGQAGVDVGPETCVALWGGEKLDLGLAVDGMFGLEIRYPRLETAAESPGK